MEYNTKTNMTLDEAIEHAQEKARQRDCIGCASEHAQLAAWLIELRDYRKKDRSN